MLCALNNCCRFLTSESVTFLRNAHARDFHVSALQMGGRINVILLDGVDGTGAKGEVVPVKRGYARNFLIPRKIAAYATDDNKNNYSELIASSASAKSKRTQGGNSVIFEKITQVELLRSLQEQLTALPESWEIRVTTAATADGRLYAAVSSTDLVEALKIQHGVDCSVAAVDIGENPIKSVGRHQITIAGQPVSVNVSIAGAAPVA